jgi:hypothetical protein
MPKQANCHPEPVEGVLIIKKLKTSTPSVGQTKSTFQTLIYLLLLI